MQRASRQLAAAGVDSPRLDAEVLLRSLLGIDRAHLYTLLHDPLPASIGARFDQLIARRLSGEPVAYITGRREFMGLEFVVDPRVLIPRPESEGLVERALRWLARHPNARRVLDIGTGSGAIAISIARLRPAGSRPLMVASDRSPAALAVARLNRDRLGARDVQLVCGSLLDWCGGRFDVIVANLPYLRESQRHAGIAWEPDTALYAEDEGFAHYAELLAQAPEHLSPGGLLACEIDPQQRARALNAAHAAFPNGTARIEADLAGHDRYLIIEEAYSS